ncbi:S1C family serine protease [Aquabacterium sp. J223]|uniref:S1C family serine protease n=1 Tax=Aquabacterium sp. J223 TaxID=2898431 RepID=UPI0021ADB5EB|nr:S1C family serine protease [Aquabacterium sp. J223]UUX95530.1 S1C family serine protease [Aquabacterium sp. J223]
MRPFHPAPLQRHAAAWLLASLLTALLLLPSAARAQATAPAQPADPQVQALTRASDAVVGLRVEAVEGAPSTQTLGRLRRGSGVVIGDDGLVLTIGYLILEAEQVQLVLDDGRVLPARVVAYDQATGFGLVQSLTPLRLAPVPLGEARPLAAGEPMMVVSGGDGAAITVARLVSQRRFTGYWEYQIEQALFTAPARPDHSGAGLFSQRGELLGIGSLLVRDAMGADGPAMVGNMFVPVDLLKPILAELRTQGRSSASRRAWLGLNCVEQAGSVQVMRLAPDSPAQAAGVQPGDRIVALDGRPVTDLASLWQAVWAGQVEREVTLDIVRGERPTQLRLKAVDREQTLSRAKGI